MADKTISVKEGANNLQFQIYQGPEGGLQCAYTLDIDGGPNERASFWIGAALDQSEIDALKAIGAKLRTHAATLRNFT